MLGVMGTPILGVPVTRDRHNGVKYLANITYVHEEMISKISNVKSNNLRVSKRKFEYLNIINWLKSVNIVQKYVNV